MRKIINTYPNHFIKAFTLIEIMVALLISGIVISMAYVILTNSQLYFDKLKNQSSYSIQYIDFYSILKKDIDRSNTILMNNNELIITTDDNRISYKLENNFFERTDLTKKINKFDINIIDIEVKYLKDTKFVNEVILQIQGINNYEINFVKQYSRQTLVNANI